MVKPVVLALVVQHPKTKATSVLSLTPDYTFSVTPKAPRQRIGPTIEVQANEAHAHRTVELPVDSLTVVYGENGEGKTTLLLDVCRTLRPYARERPLGVIWRDRSGDIRLDPGSDQETLRISGPMTANGSKQLEKRFGTVFYTTSPFESARRKQLAADGTIDVTPAFGTNSFNGTSLCMAASSLPKDIPFIRRVRVQFNISKDLNLDEEVQMYVATLYPDLSGRNSKRREEASTYVDRLTELARGLSEQMSTALAIELHRARLDGPKQSEKLLIELIGHEDRPLGNEAVRRFFTDRESQLKGRITTPHMLKALGHLKKVVAAQSPKDLLAFSRTLRSLSAMVTAGLQEAENLGLLRWNFLDLSSGQVALLMLFASLSTALDNLMRKGTSSVVLVVDEGEMFMHPAWQRKYLRDLMNFLEHYRASFKEIHLILATHSLIVAGDAPPNRLFDVKSGEMRNGFAYGPKEVLRNVYGVEEFSGNMAEALYEKIVTFLRTPTPSLRGEDEVKALIEQIASPQLRSYLLSELQRRRQQLHA